MPDDPEHPTPPIALFPTAPATPVRIVVADDNPVVRAGLTALLSGRPDITVVAEAADGREAYEAARRHRPDVVLLDVRMPGVDGISALPYLVPIAPVLMLTYSGEPETVQETLRRGADGYLVHGEFTADQLAAAVRDTARGRTHLTPTAASALLAQLRDANAHVNPHLPASVQQIPLKGLSQLQPSVGQSSLDRSRFQLSAREAEIMDLIASGMTNQQIAAACFISEKTVKNHINRIFAKLHSTSRSEAAAKWLGTAPSPGRGVG
ncbi:DNA-binding NarL/FixJ family response regulator [Streptomyces sp. SAI-135]|uniref:response regulator n=1 Tax=unclassified Streptomyces TaxID=2593676 RepID=UPI002476A9F8|nr:MULTISPECIES: response regulator transcription factor [unclassified Streptomyces]MDH6516794.1 DNA-binding NarL/FixJ family response regulator [Streptomyces sp. SAI-090]MDH6619117.1 DNA-binding NarL/FixJ family response regulator [Streptomyces sp. SAI-135]